MFPLIATALYCTGCQLPKLSTPLGTSVGSVGTSSSQRCIVNSQVFSTNWVQHEDNDLKEMSKKVTKEELNSQSTSLGWLSCKIQRRLCIVILKYLNLVKPTKPLTKNRKNHLAILKLWAEQVEFSCSNRKPQQKAQNTRKIEIKHT